MLLYVHRESTIRDGHLDFHTAPKHWSEEERSPLQEGDNSSMCTICSTLMRLTGDINAMKSALYELQAEKGEESSSVRIGTAVAFLRPCPSCLQHRAGEILVNLPNLTEVDSNHQEEEAENSEDEDPSPHLLDPFSAALEAWEEGDRPPVTVSIKKKEEKKTEGSWEIPD